MGEFNIHTFELIVGDLPPKAQELVKEWLNMYHKNLQEIWDSQLIHKLPPLKIFNRLNTQIHALVSDDLELAAFEITGGHMHDSQMAIPLLDSVIIAGMTLKTNNHNCTS